MKNLSISKKLVLGFGVVIVLLLVSGSIAYYNFSENYKYFISYRTMASRSNLISSIQSSLLQTRIGIINYMFDENAAHLDLFEKSMGRTEEFMAQGVDAIQNPEIAPLVKKSSDLLLQYNREAHALIELQKKSVEDLQALNSIGPVIEQKLAKLMADSESAGDVVIAYDAALALKSLLLGRLAVFKFRGDNSENNAEDARVHFKESLRIISGLEGKKDRIPQSNPGEIKTLLNKYVASFENMQELLLERNQIMKDELTQWGPVIAGSLASADDLIKQEQEAFGHVVQSRNESAQSMVGGLCLVALFVGVLAGFYITRSIVKPLSLATAFANDVAKGNFTTELSVSQKDEVGKICVALDSIRGSISGAADEVEGIVARVEQGDMQAKGDQAAFSGGFSALVDGVNTLVRVYTSFFDQLPVGVMALTKNHDVTYLNKTARKMSGVFSCAGRKCSDLFNTGDCNSEKCASDISMRKKNIAVSETKARTSDGDYEVSYTSIPLITRSGEVAGAAEVIIDQTLIKNAQRTMIAVAEKANQIADRVASASEELSAQVEQVSSGAEIQQQRVAETATAMEEMNATVLEVAKNATEATTESNTAKEKAETGAQLVQKVVQAINQVNNVAGMLQTDMEKLGKEAQSIGGVMTVITDIADQTNLLALNAAIEAARAGEAGRGFAVVADEVRKLAEKTMEATKEVGDNIRVIQSATEKTIKNVDEAVASVAEATGMANNSGEALAQIVRMTTDTSDLISSIATAAEQQSATSEEINNAIDEVNRIVSETADGMSQSASAVQELAKMAHELKSALDNLSSNAA